MVCRAPYVVPRIWTLATFVGVVPRTFLAPCGPLLGGPKRHSTDGPTDGEKPCAVRVSVSGEVGEGTRQNPGMRQGSKTKKRA
jgi:hypothetical protein